MTLRLAILFALLALTASAQLPPFIINLNWRVPPEPAATVSNVTLALPVKGLVVQTSTNLTDWQTVAPAAVTLTATNGLEPLRAWRLARVAEYTVVWDASPDPSAVGTMLVAGVESGSYCVAVDCQASTEATVTVTEGQPIYLAAQAYTADKTTSTNSNEICLTLK